MRKCGRLAPSPTGALHLGNARTFLIAWLSMRSQDGKIILRIEDLDHPKVKSWATEQTIKDLKWLGLDWDEGPDVGGISSPYIQSQRIHLYKKALDKLIISNSVYPCICSRKDIETSQSAPHIGEDGPKYAGTCNTKFASYYDAKKNLADNRLPGWRFRALKNTFTSFHDQIHGENIQDVSATIGDFSIARHPDGAGYQLAVVVDDALMGVTEVVRGDDLLTTTHRQLQLQNALGYTAPQYIHVPLMVGSDGKRLAKRHGDTRIDNIKKAGTRPERLLGYLAYTCGWAEKEEELSIKEVLQRYNLQSLPTLPTIVDEQTLQYLGI
jgi:glutamyl-tRNA synthetase